MKLLKGIATALIFSVGASVFADEAYDVVKRFTELTVPKYSKATMIMDIFEKGKLTEHREMIEYGSNQGSGGLKNVIFDIKQPASLKDTRVLQSEKTNKEDDRWIYEPSLKMTRRIQAGERSKSFVGCEFTYNDMTIRKVDEDTHEMLSDSERITVNGISYNCWKIKSVPKKKNDIEYSSRICFYDKDTLLPVKMDYYDKKNPDKLFKTYEIEKIEHVKGATGIDYVLRRSIMITNVATGRQTRVGVKDFVFDDEKKVNKNMFNSTWLQNGR